MVIEEHIRGTVSFRNGTEIALDDSNVISASVKRQCCSEGKFDFGGVFSACLSLRCRLIGTNTFNIRGAKIVLSSSYNQQNYEQIGVFWVTSAKRTGEIYSLTCYDGISWLDTSSTNYTNSDGEIFDSVARCFESQGMKTISGLLKTESIIGKDKNPRQRILLSLPGLHISGSNCHPTRHKYNLG